MKLAAFTNAISPWAGAEFRIVLWTRGGHIIQGQFISVINLPGGVDLVRIRTSEVAPERVLVDLESIDAVGFIHA
jgi:hypothetical protein